MQYHILRNHMTAIHKIILQYDQNSIQEIEMNHSNHNPN